MKIEPKDLQLTPEEISLVECWRAAREKDKCVAAAALDFDYQPPIIDFKSGLETEI